MPGFFKKRDASKKKAFLAQVEPIKNKLYRTAFLYVKNKHDATDIVQETMFKAYQNYENVRSIEAFNTWITKILIHSALDFIRKQKRLVIHEEIDEAPFIHSELSTEVVNHLALKEALETLDYETRTAIILRYYYDFKIKDIAETLNTPEGM
ncbi:RNA polymerase sigma-70 factor (ECF subfamily) [Pullulanibacillus pueri]|uniref:DNA-directed RNA polymerase sigma-70 factor n=1 Tax=Pullulanibacillus pueri TaxID=1437324 RepID=A0A8J3EPE8_9BACL|nr:sigma-70 family RNA polymerase sigma factor [Pullulanibacillus pueri]MBM7683375.1 RNA polymerase sigma-70 factor (ECF subfamily) [Pullulanibacillus pueri]GGH86560.1 DNA-directed RNA polymerase sigma-70 factor [Pullulanibacillus pueri]